MREQRAQLLGGRTGSWGSGFRLEALWHIWKLEGKAGPGEMEQGGGAQEGWQGAGVLAGGRRDYLFLPSWGRVLRQKDQRFLGIYVALT